MKRLPDLEAFVRTIAPVYATDHRYADIILGIIHSDNLTRYDVGAAK